MDDEQRELKALGDKLKFAGRTREPTKMSEVLSQLLSRRGYLQTFSDESLQQAWQIAVGPELATQTRPGRVRGGVLEVHTMDSTVIQELTLRKRELLRRLHLAAPDQKIRDLRFRAGEFH